MTSLLKANNVAPAAGGTPRNLPRGVAAAIFGVNLNTNTIQASSNVSSYADLGVGIFSLSFASAMSGSYALATSGKLDNDNNGAETLIAAFWRSAQANGPASMTLSSQYNSAPGNSGVDAFYVCGTVHGDLA